MSEGRKKDEDPFFSSIRTLKAMIQPKSPHLDILQSTNSEGKRDVANNTTSIVDTSNIQTIRNVLNDLQSRQKEAEEVAAQELVRRLAVERERDEIQTLWKAAEGVATESASCREALEQELGKAISALRTAEELVAEERWKNRQIMERDMVEIQSSLKVAEKAAAEEKSLRLATEQLLLDMQMTRNSERENIETETEIRSNLEQEIRELRHQLRDAEVTIDKVKSEKIAVEQQLHDANRSLKEEETNSLNEKQMRLAAEEKMLNVQTQFNAAAVTAEQDKRNLQSSLNDAEKLISKERALRLAVEQDRDKILLKYEDLKQEMENRVPQIETPLRNSQLIDDLNARLSAAEATAEKEKQQRLAIEQERDEVILECRETRILFESPMKGDPYFLKKEAQRLLTSRIEERKKHLKEMDRIHLQLQRAISQRDSMEARLQGSKKISDNLSDELDKAYSIIRELRGEDDAKKPIGIDMNNLTPGKHGRSDGTDPMQPVEESEIIVGRTLIDDNEQLGSRKRSKVSDTNDDDDDGLPT